MATQRRRAAQSPKRRPPRNYKRLDLLLTIALVVLLACAVVLFRMSGQSAAFQGGDASASTAEVSTPSDAEQSAPATGISSAQATEPTPPATSSAPEEQPEEPVEPEPAEPQPSDITVCLDPGHGAHDPGCNTETRTEKDDTLALALVIRDVLETEGMNVVMTRSDDSYLTLKDRCKVANNAKADYFISIHRNFADGVGYGVEVWKSHDANEEASLLADTVSAGLEGAGVQRNRGVHVGSQGSESEDYLVLRETNMPAILIEMGFIENEEDNRYFDDYQVQYAQAIAQAVMDTYTTNHSGQSADAS